MLWQWNYLLPLTISGTACSKSLQSSSCETMNCVTCVELFWLGSTSSVAPGSLPSSLRGMSPSALYASKRALRTLGTSCPNILSLICVQMSGWNMNRNRTATGISGGNMAWINQSRGEGLESFGTVLIKYIDPIQDCKHVDYNMDSWVNEKGQCSPD